MGSLPQAASHGQRAAAVVGMFDGVHLGHRYLLSRLKTEASLRGLSPTVFTFPFHPLATVDPAIAPKLLCEPAEKLILLDREGIHPGQVNYLVFNEAFRRLTAAEFMRLLHERYRVDFILRGFNNRFGTERGLSADDYRRIAASNGIELIDAESLKLPAPEDGASLTVSSSEIRKALLSGDISRANAMSGYPYTITGLVVGGKHLGRTLGFPTANIALRHPSKLVPEQGVYICTASAQGRIYKAMVNIGRRPTVDTPEAEQTIEAHLLGFDGDLYGKEVTLQFYRRLRPEMRFPSIDALAARLEADRIETELFDIPV